MATAMLFGCSSTKPETVQDCKDRFTKLVANAPNQGRMQYDFTYEVYDPKGLMDQARADRSQLSISKNGGAQAIQQFLQAPAVPVGAYFVSDDLILHKVIGVEAGLASAIDVGCTKAPKGSKLYHVSSTPIAVPSKPG